VYQRYSWDWVCMVSTWTCRPSWDWEYTNVLTTRTGQMYRCT